MSKGFSVSFSRTPSHPTRPATAPIEARTFPFKSTSSKKGNGKGGSNTSSSPFPGGEAKSNAGESQAPRCVQGNNGDGTQTRCCIQHYQPGWNVPHTLPNGSTSWSKAPLFIGRDVIACRNLTTNETSFLPLVPSRK